MMLGPSQVRFGYLKFLEMTNEDIWAVFLGAGKPRRAFLTMPRPQPGEKKDRLIWTDILQVLVSFSSYAMANRGAPTLQGAQKSALLTYQNSSHDFCRGTTWPKAVSRS